MNDLTRGRLVEALSSNLLVVVALLSAAAGVLWWGAVRAAGTGGEPFPFLRRKGTRRALAIGLPLLFVAFGTARWVPPLAWAAP